MPEQPSRGERGRQSARESCLRHEEDRDRSPLPRRTSPPRPSLPDSSADLPELEPAFWQIFDDGLRRLGLELSAGARAAIDAQARLLVAWNAAINLTALRTPEQIARRHLLDSLAALPLLRRLGGQSLLDLGSGGGYPGLPLAVALPAARCALVDSVAKKASFLDVAARAAAEAMKQAGEQPPLFAALAERAEDMADEPDQREAWQLVVARAVGPLAEVVELSVPLLTVGGHLLAWKRRSADGGLGRELTAARRVLQAVGASAPRTERPTGLDELGLAEHVLIVVRKLRPTPERYPRPAGERRRALR